MILVPCPWCGPRNAAEFRFVGESKSRPTGDDIGLLEWRAFLYVKANPAGWVDETMYHRAGCRRYFTLERHTITNECRSSRPPAAPSALAGEPP